MAQKNLMAQVVRPVNPTTTGEVPAPELVELSEEDLLHIIGGVATISITIAAARCAAQWVGGFFD